MSRITVLALAASSALVVAPAATQATDRPLGAANNAHPLEVNQMPTLPPRQRVYQPPRVQVQPQVYPVVRPAIVAAPVRYRAAPVLRPMVQQPVAPRSVVRVVTPRPVLVPVDRTARYNEPLRYVAPIRYAEPARYAEPPRYAERPRYAEPIRYAEPVRYVEPVRYAAPLPVARYAPAYIPPATTYAAVTTYSVVRTYRPVTPPPAYLTYDNDRRYWVTQSASYTSIPLPPPAVVYTETTTTALVPSMSYRPAASAYAPYGCVPCSGYRPSLGTPFVVPRSNQSILAIDAGD